MEDKLFIKYHQSSEDSRTEQDILAIKNDLDYTISNVLFRLWKIKDRTSIIFLFTEKYGTNVLLFVNFLKLRIDIFLHMHPRELDKTCKTIIFKYIWFLSYLYFLNKLLWHFMKKKFVVQFVYLDGIDYNRWWM